MRICLAISGKLRCFKHCQERLQKYILDPLQPDVFFYGYENKEGQTENEKDIKKLWNPIKYDIGIETPEIIQFLRDKYHRPEYDTRKAPTTEPDRVYGQYSNLYEVARMIRSHENRNKFRYDVVIRSRCDYFYHRTPSQDELKLASEGNILIPSCWSFPVFDSRAKSDAFAMTDSDGFQKYASLINHIKGYFDQGATYHHETLTGIHVDAMGLKYIPVDPPHMYFEFPEELSHIKEKNRHNY